MRTNSDYRPVIDLDAERHIRWTACILIGLIIMSASGSVQRIIEYVKIVS